MAGDTAKGRRWITGAALMALLATGMAAPPAHAAPGDDCGGADTPPAHQLTSGQTCAGSLNEAPVSEADEGQGYMTHRYEDAYVYARTDGDLVRIDSNLPACTVTEPVGQFIADSDGLAPLAVKGRRSSNITPNITGPCPNQPGDYTVKVTVTPNDRPAISPDNIQTSGQRGDEFKFKISGTDADGNLTSLGLRWGDSNNYEWNSQAIATGAWSTEFTVPLYSDQTVRFYAKDSYGAVSPASASFFIDVLEDDCGLGRDAGVETVSLPFHCTAWFESQSDVDSFLFTPSLGQRAHVRVTPSLGDQGWWLTLTSPSGAVFTTTYEDNPDLYGTTEPGQWRADMRGDGDVASYAIDVTQVGAPIAPTLSVNADASAVQGDWFPINMTATDPNGQTLSYRIDWDNGSSSIWPLEGRANSGETVTGARRFMYLTPSQHNATITVTNTDGLSASTQITVNVVPHNDCGLGNPSYDAPDSASGAVAMPNPCTGQLGYHRPSFENSLDQADYFRSPLTCLPWEACKLKVTLTTSAGLSANVLIDDGVSPRSSGCGYGCTTSATTLGPTVLVGSYPRIAVGLNGGKGSYTLAVERVPVNSLPNI